MLNLIAGLTTADSGKVFVAEERLDLLDEQKRTLFRRRKIGFVFQFFHLVPTLTVEENLRLPLQLNGMESPNELARLGELLERVGLSSKAGQLPDRLSGGEQQRVAVCRAVLHRPPVILADEPTGNLDGGSADSVLELLFEFAQSGKSTLIVVTHSEAVASACDRVQRMVDGALI